MPSPELAVSVVICAYTDKRWDDLKACIASVQGQSVPAHEVVLVVDHNPALFATALTELAGVTVVENDQERGLGGARNTGASRSRGEIVAFLDDDAVASPDWLEQMEATYCDPSILGVGGTIEASVPSGRATWFPSEFDWVVGCTYRGMPQQVTPVRNLLGCNMSFRRHTFQDIGGFRLGYGCDETEFCIRLGNRWPTRHLVYNPRVKVLHRVSAARMSWRYFVSRCYFEGGSKAVVTWLVGANKGLASERAYTVRTLPKGVIRGARDAIVSRDLSGLARSGAIVLGLSCTTAGYVAGKLSTLEFARRRGYAEPAVATAG